MRTRLPENISIQGNLDPAVLLGPAGPHSPARARPLDPGHPLPRAHLQPRRRDLARYAARERASARGCGPGFRSRPPGLAERPALTDRTRHARATPRRAAGGFCRAGPGRFVNAGLSS